jgi:hypothetical protein
MLSIQVGVPCLARGSLGPKVAVGAGVKVAVTLLDVGALVAAVVAAGALATAVALVGAAVAASVSVAVTVAVSSGVSDGWVVGTSVLVWVAVGAGIVAVTGAVKIAATLVAIAESLKVWEGPQPTRKTIIKIMGSTFFMVLSL